MWMIFMSCKWSFYTASGSVERRSSASGTRPSRFPRRPRRQRAFAGGRRLENRPRTSVRPSMPALLVSP